MIIMINGLSFINVVTMFINYMHVFVSFRFLSLEFVCVVYITDIIQN